MRNCAKIRYSDGPFDAGDRVFCKRDQYGPWRGPGKVLLQKGQEVVVKDGGQIVTVHAFRVSKANLSDALKECEKPSPSTPTETVSHMPYYREQDYCPEWSHGTRNSSDVAEDIVDENGQRRTIPNDQNEQQPVIQAGRDSETVPTKIPKNGSQVMFRLNNDPESRYVTKLVVPAGKKSGKHKNWLNLCYSDPEWVSGKTGPVEWYRDVSSWEYVDEQAESSDVFAVYADLVWQAKMDEFRSWRENDVYNSVENCGQKCVTVRWVFTSKDDGLFKARLVARGFQEDKTDLMVDSPKCSRESRRNIQMGFALP